MGAGLALAAVGLAILTRAGATDGLAAIVGASIVISLGLAPVFGLTTELIVGSAPPERAGAASGISETGAELGGALGISILGSIGVAIYRGDIARSLPDTIPASAQIAARDTLGGAVGAASELTNGMGTVLLDVARNAFTQGMVVAAAISTVVAVGVAVLALVALRNVRMDPDAGGPDESASAEPEPESRPRPNLRPAAAPVAEC
jgi:DHA2 family multidrug resistance protein-like MFS transporter